MHGPLSEIGLVEVLQLLERGRRSGRLRIVGADPTAPRTIVLHRGEIASLLPDADDAAVAALLVRRQLRRAEDPASPLARLGVARAELARRAIARMLSWTRGRFDFEEAETSAGPLAMSIDQLLLGFVESESLRADLGARLGEFRLVPVFSAGTPRTPGGGWRALDWRLLDAVDGVRDIAAIAAALDEPLEVVGARVEALQEAAILDLVPAPPDTRVEARAAIEAGRYEEAIARLQARVRAVPTDAEAWRTLGLAEVGAGRFDRAMAAWDGWRQAAPERQAEAVALIEAARTMLEAMHDTRE
jgi:tetratricopeptide (TPR) repeat protein